MPNAAVRNPRGYDLVDDKAAGFLKDTVGTPLNDVGEPVPFHCAGKKYLGCVAGAGLLLQLSVDAGALSSAVGAGVAVVDAAVLQ